MPIDNVTLENTQQSISSRDAKSVASVMVNGKWVNLSDTLEQANVKSDVGTVAKQVAAQQEVLSNAASTADSAVAYANDAIEKSKVNSQAIDDINSAVSDAASDAAVARSDGLRAWNAAQSNVNLIDLNYASASASISSARTEALAAADEAKSSASVAQAGVVAVKSDVAAVQADVTATRSDVAVAKSDIADTKTTLAQTASDLNSKITGVETSLADTTSALSDAKTAFNSDVAEAKNLANAAQSTADNAVKSASSVTNDLTAVASQAKSNADGITKVTSDVGLLQTTVADNSGNISKIQETAKQIQQAVSDNAGNITIAKQTADSAVAVASDAKSNATVAIQTASQASITASNASGQAASAVLTANGAMTTASNANSYATVAVQTANGASLTATNATNDATVAKQTASEAKIQASNAESDFAQLSVRANKIETNVANNSGAIASVQQTANGLTTTVADITSNGGGRNLWISSKSFANTNVNAPEVDWNTDSDGMVTAHITGNGGFYGKWQYIYANNIDPFAIGDSATFSVKMKGSGTITIGRENNFQKAITLTSNWTRYAISGTVNHTNSAHIIYNESGKDCDAYVRLPMVEKGTVAHDWSPAPEDAQNQFTQIKQSINGVATIINDPKTGLNATYQTAAGNATTISNINGDVSQLKVSASSASVALSDAAGNISSLQATASELETKYADAAGDISQIKTDAKGMTQTISDAQGDIAKLKTRTDGFDTQFANINGDINKIQTNATGVTQTLTNAKSDIAVLQSRADGFDAKYATAAGDINTLKTNASGFSQTLTNAQGDISTLKSTVSGVQTTLTDAQGNISTLQSDVSGLKKTTSDNAGNISTLQATAQTLTSQMSGAQGDISTLKQTASGISSQVTVLSDKAMQNRGTVDSPDFNSLTQAGYYTITSPINGKNYPIGSWGTLEVSGQVTDNNGRLNQKYVADNNGPIYTRQYNNLTKSWTAWFKVANQNDIDTLNGKITANTTQITQNKQAIALKADQTTVDNTNGTVQQLQSQLQVQADQIATKVSSSDLDAKGYATQTYTQTQIKQTSDSLNANITSIKSDLTQSYTNLSASVDSIKADVYNSDGSSKITQLSNLISIKVSQDDYNSQITQLNNNINLRVSKGDVISQINQEAGGNTLIQVSNGKGSLVLDADNTVITGKAWIPVAAIADLTADQIQAGTLTGSTVHLGDSSGNTIDLGVLGTNHVGLHSKATNGDQTYIDLNGIHNFGTTYDTKISQGQITTNLLSVNGGGLIDFRSGGSGATLSEQEFQFYNSNSVNGGLSFSGSVPIAPAADGAGGNELRIRYDRSFAVTPISDDSARICASPAVLELGFIQSGSSTPDLNNTGLWVDRNNRYMNLGVWETDSTWTRISAGSHNIQMQANDAHAGLYNNNFHIYRDNDGGSATATELQVDGWAWVRGWVEAAGHSQHSALSTKTALQAIDDDEMLAMVNNTDLASFLFKTDVASGETHRHIGLIIDDVHDVAQYQTPQDFIAPNGVSRDDDNMIGALFGAVQALTKRINALESKVG